MSRVARAAVALGLAAAVLAGGCSAPAASPEWLEPTLAPPSTGDVFVAVSRKHFADLPAAAAFAGNVVLGSFTGAREVRSHFAVFPDSEISRDLPDAAKGLLLSLWEFEVAGVVKGGLRPGDAVTVLVELEESDVEGLVTDPGRVGTQPVVLFLDDAQSTSGGPAHFATGAWQLGMSFAVVRHDGTLAVDPRGRAAVPERLRLKSTWSRLGPEELLAAVASQLGLATASP